MKLMNKTEATRRYTLYVRIKYMFLLISIFAIIIAFNNGSDIIFLNNERPESPYSYHIKLPESDESFTIKTEGCSIPGLKPFDHSILKYIEHPKDHSCPNADISLLGNNQSHIWIRAEMFEHYGILDKIFDSNSMLDEMSFSCCYQSFFRPSAVADISSIHIDDRVQYEACINFTTIIKVLNEFVKVRCSLNEKKIYEEFFLFAPKKPSMASTQTSRSIQSESQSNYNIIIIGIDAVSRLNFHRTMPKTLRFLKNKGAVELLGYNKVGDNTFPNLTPMLMGIKETELKKTCLPNSKNTFDNCPFIWEWYKDAGYYTGLGEDSASLGTFNYVKNGFSRTPTDYYIHTFVHEAEKFAGNNKDFNSYLCMGHKYFYQVLLDYIEDLTKTLRSSKFFGFFWEVTMSHDYLNYPMIMDDSYEAFLSKLDDTDYLDETIIVMLSDHGIRWGDIRMTKQGRLEERLPFVYILVPPSFKANYTLAHYNLVLNSKRLSTPFDIHETLSDLINLEDIKNVKIKERTEKFYFNRGISLFLPIPENRTCEQADIDAHWCTCHKGNKVSTESTEAREAAEFLVWHLNSLLEYYPQCARLGLKHLKEVTEMVAGETTSSEESWREFLVVIHTTPGDGIFEATLRHYRSWMVTGTVSRLNLYGEQSKCIHNYQLKLYCYCS